MTRTRSAKLRRLNLLIGMILVIAGVTGGFLLTFWLLVLLLSLTCVAASWIMAWTALRGREGHSIAAIFVTLLFLAWLGYFLQMGADMPMWYGVFLMWSLLMIQGAVYLLAVRRAANAAEMALSRAAVPEREGTLARR
jgi:hypothetical protein